MKRLSILEERKRLRRKALKGFPWNGRFETKEEVYRYFSGDKIQCLLCGKWFQRLPTHLSMIHNSDSDEYKEMYGLPWKHALCGTQVSLKLSEIMKRRRENGFRADIDAAREKSRGIRQRQDQPFFSKIRAENMVSGNRKRMKYRQKDFQNVLKRMLEQNKTLEEVCKDADMPTYRTVYGRSRKNAEFKKALDKTYQSLPFSVQAKANKLSADKFRKAIASLRGSGVSVLEISRYLGVSENMVRRWLKSE